MKPILNASFFRSDNDNEPVREWLKALSATERRVKGGRHQNSSIRLASGHAFGQASRRWDLGDQDQT